MLYSIDDPPAYTEILAWYNACKTDRKAAMLHSINDPPAYT